MTTMKSWTWTAPPGRLLLVVVASLLAAFPSRATTVDAAVATKRVHDGGGAPLPLPPPTTTATAPFPEIQRQRRRAEGEGEEGEGEGGFSTLNSLLSEISLRLPDAIVSSSGLDLTISQLTCDALRVDDARLSHADSPDDDTSVEVRLDVSGLSVECALRWDYKWTIFSGGGTGYASLDPSSSSAHVSIAFASVDYDSRPPHDATVSACDAPVNIDDMGFEGDGLGMIGGIMDLFEGLLRGTVEGRVRDAACDELRKLAGGGGGRRWKRRRRRRRRPGLPPPGRGGEDPQAPRAARFESHLPRVGGE